ncbi:hypothetical protein BH09ACT10_BH09ACT10_28580 [soil metagenome]
MTTTSSPGQPTARSGRSRVVALIALLVGIAIGSAAVLLFESGQGSDESAPSSDARFSDVSRSCDAWTNSSPATAVRDSQWCSDMFAWMSNQSTGSMMGNMMWQGSEQLGTSCRTWVGQDHPDSRASDLLRCDEMVDWMDDHMLSRGGHWMMNDR